MTTPSEDNLYYIPNSFIWELGNDANITNILVKAYVLIRKQCGYTYTNSTLADDLAFLKAVKARDVLCRMSLDARDNSYSSDYCGMFLWLSADKSIKGVCDINKFSINRFCVAEQGKGDGAKFYKMIVEYWFKNFSYPLYIRADKKVVGFFEKQGARILANTYKTDKWLKKWKKGSEGGAKDVVMYPVESIPLLPAVLNEAGHMDPNPGKYQYLMNCWNSIDTLYTLLELK